MVATQARTLGETLDRLQSDLALSTEEIASALSVSSEMVDRWIAGDLRPAEKAQHRLEELLGLSEHLHETFRPEGIPRWLREPNRYIGSMTKKPTTPAEAIVKGRFDWVEGALVVIDYGMFV